ncbi:hypothetical protein HKX48_006703 [Thoreauomyces humboldtii]|nr:hypothetical protein HKX48_006703 [Thoreauomyces humboldtii]
MSRPNGSDYPSIGQANGDNSLFETTIIRTRSLTPPPPASLAARTLLTRRRPHDSNTHSSAQGLTRSVSAAGLFTYASLSKLPSPSRQTESTASPRLPLIEKRDASPAPSISHRDESAEVEDMKVKMEKLKESFAMRDLCPTRRYSGRNEVPPLPYLDQAAAPAAEPRMALARIETQQQQQHGQMADPDKGVPQACLFVASLSSSRSDTDLQRGVTEHFQQWGRLLHVKVLKDWLSRPYAFVQFKEVRDARRALVEAHNTVIHNRYIRVEQARVNRTLFIAKFTKTIGEVGREFSDAKKRYGPVEDLTILQNYQTGRSKGCGFIKYCYREDAIKAYLGIRTHLKWVAEWAANLDRGEVDVDHTSVFVGQLNQTLVTKEMLEDRFGRYGEILSLHLVNRFPTGPNTRPAFAFIKFRDEETTRNVVQNEVTPVLLTRRLLLSLELNLLKNSRTWLDRNIRVQLRETANHRNAARGQLSPDHHLNLNASRYLQGVGSGPRPGRRTSFGGYSDRGGGGQYQLAMGSGTPYIGQGMRQYLPLPYDSGAKGLMMPPAPMSAPSHRRQPSDPLYYEYYDPYMMYPYHPQHPVAAYTDYARSPNDSIFGQVSFEPWSAGAAAGAESGVGLAPVIKDDGSAYAVPQTGRRSGDRG